MSHANRLISESSPYLIQHAHNPVNWYPWGQEALDRAKSEDKPIFLSIGYSSCHWCHVMAKECFANRDIARIMNENYVCIKVDREERPDLDELYMSSVQMMTGRGGWPLNVFLTPDLRPFFGGTYFPPQPVADMESFPNVLEKIATAFHEQRDVIEKGSEALINTLVNSESKTSFNEASAVDGEFLDQERNRLTGIFDTQFGGFGEAPKFPQPGALLFLMDEFWRTGDSYLLKIVDTTLDQMSAGGIHDQIGGGFHRYAVDRQWRIPHFEKMLYDNALLAKVYTRAWQVMGKDAHAVTGRKILDFLLCEMRDPRGGFYSAIDADSEHEEGRFYTWNMSELLDCFDIAQMQRFSRAYGVAPDGNFTGGRSVLHLPRDLRQTAMLEKRDMQEFEQEMELCREKLYQVRSRRNAPLVDKKIITAWNGLVIGALSFAGVVYGEERYLAAARRAADYILRRHKAGAGLAHSSIADRAGGAAFLDDYAFLIQGLLDLYTATLKERYFTGAVQLAKSMIRKFRDSKGGLFYSPKSGYDDIALPSRPRKMLDGATPSPTAIALEVIGRIAEITQDEMFVNATRGLERELAWYVRSVPWGSHYALKVASTRLLPHSQVVIVGPANAEETRALAQEARRYSKPDVLMVWAPPGKKGAPMRAISPLLKGKKMKDRRPTAYFCSGKTCFPPITEPNKLREFLRAEKSKQDSKT